jgi:peptide/nickel transport system substrate-binding protein
MTKKTIAIAVIFIIAVSGLTGCGQTPNFLTGSTEQSVDTVRSEEVYIPIEKIRTLNPLVTKDEDAYYVDKLIYEGMFGFDNNLALTNILADGYSFAADGLSLTVNLKQGILWQDGKELTAEDVKFTMDTIAAAVYSGGTIYASNISNVKYTKLNNKDPYQITIYFNDPKNISLANLTFPIIPRHQFKNVEAARTAAQDFIPIGTGPYKVTDYNELSHVIVMGNESYHGVNKPDNKLNFQIIPEKRDAINLMDVNNISVTFSKEIDRDTIYSNKNVNIVNFPSNEVELVGYNFRNTALKDAKVRKAIASAIDTEEIIESAYYKNGIRNENIYFPNFLGISAKNTGISYNIVKAKELLKEAGYVDRNGDGYLENALNERLSVNLLVNSEDQSRTAAAQIIKEGLEQLPIQTTVTSKDWNGYNSDLAAGNYDIYLGGYQIKENYDLRFLLHTSYGNQIGYANPALDALLDKMESGISQKERQETYKQIGDILANELPYYCLLYKTYGAIASPVLKGEIHPTFLNLYAGADQWYCMLEVRQELQETAADEASQF